MTQFEALIKSGLSEAEARQVIEDDKLIDKGIDLFPLTDEQKSVEKKMRQADRAVPTVYKFQKRERKANNDKRFLIDALKWCLTTDIEQDGDNVLVDEVIITNPERQIDFIYNGVKYRIVLSAPRK